MNIHRDDEGFRRAWDFWRRKSPDEPYPDVWPIGLEPATVEGWSVSGVKKFCFKISSFLVCFIIGYYFGVIACGR